MLGPNDKHLPSFTLLPALFFPFITTLVFPTTAFTPRSVLTAIWVYHRRFLDFFGLTIVPRAREAELDVSTIRGLRPHMLFLRSNKSSSSTNKSSTSASSNHHSPPQSHTIPRTTTAQTLRQSISISISTVTTLSVITATVTSSDTNQESSFATSTSISQDAPSLTSIPETPSPSSAAKLPNTILFIIIFTVVLGCLVCGIALLFLCRRRKSQTPSAKNLETGDRTITPFTELPSLASRAAKKFTKKMRWSTFAPQPSQLSPSSMRHGLDHSGGTNNVEERLGRLEAFVTRHDSSHMASNSINRTFY
ncbi:hypothetical protein GALMADRAFT_142736 [Galerina marginata CBS 339.88]|uniref:Uncharacterized protein n=1 Tax=Galerina marginata (strain CBS 339.88) TaxID=685588 RepID=A0A067T208_GALM3|nr:hypothetical protein GALMADRAFT_142736 [Galerina marginata CBS 339.88]